MLRISKIVQDEENLTLKLDGKIEGMYTEELEQACKGTCAEDKKTITLDFSGVTFIDEKGLAALSKLQDGRLNIVRCSPFIRTLLSDLMNEGQE
ncbi:MAG: STAS domain-containing protein [Candidatus Dadabacteria bacterium]|nr:STAS domain-containing protein [Candidatus Dadabacteria bacterium]